MISWMGLLNLETADSDGDHFLYLPARKRVRRIVSTQKHLRFVNTDFTHEDMERRKVEREDNAYVSTTCYL